MASAINGFLTLERLKQALRYDMETGRFVWSAPLGARGQAGALAGNIDSRYGYRRIGIDGRLYRANRLAWLYVYGEWPEGDVDHINGFRDDDRIANLRDVSRQMNNQNTRRAISRNRSGALGVSTRRPGRWSAQIWVDGVRHYLGQFNSVEAAATAYIAAKRRMHAGNTI